MEKLISIVAGLGLITYGLLTTEKNSDKNDSAINQKAKGVPNADKQESIPNDASSGDSDSDSGKSVEETPNHLNLGE